MVFRSFNINPVIDARARGCTLNVVQKIGLEF